MGAAGGVEVGAHHLAPVVDAEGAGLDGAGHVDPGDLTAVPQVAVPPAALLFDDRVFSL